MQNCKIIFVNFREIFRIANRKNFREEERFLKRRKTERKEKIINTLFQEHSFIRELQDLLAPSRVLRIRKRNLLFVRLLLAC